jgi:hypothetical protein
MCVRIRQKLRVSGKIFCEPFEAIVGSFGRLRSWTQPRPAFSGDTKFYIGKRAGGAVVHVYGGDLESMDKIAEAAKGYGKRAGFTIGDAKFVGTSLG